MDCFLIAHCIWIEQEQINDMQELVADVLKKHGYALSVSLKPIRHQIKEFEKEVREDTIVIKQRWEDEYIVVDNDYYEMDNTDVGSYNKIKIVDFDKLKSNSETSNRVNLYKPNSNRTTNVILRFTEENGLEYHSEAYNYNFNSTWRPLKLKTQRVCKNEKYTQKPNHRLKKQWDIQVKEIKFEIKKQIQKVEIHREKNLPHLRTNSFVNKDFANLIETNLFDIIRNLQDENIEISRIQYYYENIK